MFKIGKLFHLTHVGTISKPLTGGMTTCSQSRASITAMKSWPDATPPSLQSGMSSWSR